MAAVPVAANVARMLLLGLGIWRNDGVVKSMTRYGDRRFLCQSCFGDFDRCWMRLCCLLGLQGASQRTPFLCLHYFSGDPYLLENVPHRRSCCLQLVRRRWYGFAHSLSLSLSIYLRDVHYPSSLLSHNAPSFCSPQPWSIISILLSYVHSYLFLSLIFSLTFPFHIILLTCTHTFCYGLNWDETQWINQQNFPQKVRIPHVLF